MRSTRTATIKRKKLLIGVISQKRVDVLGECIELENLRQSFHAPKVATGAEIGRNSKRNKNDTTTRSKPRVE